MKKLIILIILVFLLIPSSVQASDGTLSEEEIINSQQESLNIQSFIEEADQYTEDVYQDIDMGELFSSAITGDIDNASILRSILNAMRWGSN